MSVGNLLFDAVCHTFFRRNDVQFPDDICANNLHARFEVGFLQNTLAVGKAVDKFVCHHIGKRKVIHAVGGFKLFGIQLFRRLADIGILFDVPHRRIEQRACVVRLDDVVVQRFDVGKH